jgi:hypothetical protein
LVCVDAEGIKGITNTFYEIILGLTLSAYNRKNIGDLDKEIIFCR